MKKETFSVVIESHMTKKHNLCGWELCEYVLHLVYVLFTQIYRSVISLKPTLGLDKEELPLERK